MNGQADRCDTHACERSATEFEVVTGESWQWCAECWREIQQQRREVRELISAAKWMDAALQAKYRGDRNE